MNGFIHENIIPDDLHDPSGNLLSKNEIDFIFEYLIQNPGIHKLSRIRTPVLVLKEEGPPAKEKTFIH